MGDGRNSLDPNLKNAGRDRKLKAAVVIAAGGTGTRMQSTVPKQFLDIAGKPILLHTVAGIAALEEVTQIVIALPSEHIAEAQSILQREPTRIAVQCVQGGSSRQESVMLGVAHIRPDADIIMVHDAVRPFCDRSMMERILKAAWENGAAVPGLPATETIKRKADSGHVLPTPPREELYAIQTPQAFHAKILRSALKQAAESGFSGTDESSVVQWAGHPVIIVEGSSENIKITRPLDLEIAEMLIAKRKGECAEMNGIRIGQGIDYHRLVEGRKLILGGVEIPFEKGLEGHSDADVLIHAVCDALLGAAAMGDIGQHFPDTDPANKGKNSLEFLREVRTKIEAAGWLVRNLDVTLLAQRPKVAPYALAMKQNIAKALGLDLTEVSVKATTTEGLNAEGRGEGMSAQAVALLCKR
jgi:2-C-methyl-D-erythritol 4-phosphate cytidylyltransferase / 2-C-methyl-D-erythritol 2,4-cyclodiphosphate synthase